MPTRKHGNRPRQCPAGSGSAPPPVLVDRVPHAAFCARVATQVQALENEMYKEIASALGRTGDKLQLAHTQMLQAEAAVDDIARGAACLLRLFVCLSCIVLYCSVPRALRWFTYLSFFFGRTPYISFCIRAPSRRKTLFFVQCKILESVWPPTASEFLAYKYPLCPLGWSCRFECFCKNSYAAFMWCDTAGFPSCAHKHQASKITDGGVTARV